MKKLRYKYKSRYLISQNGSYTNECLMNLFMKINL